MTQKYVRYNWTINGTVMPRNPSEFTLKATKGNVSYQDVMDGTQRRQKLPRKTTARDCTLTWAAMSPSEYNNIMKLFAIDQEYTIEIGGLQPRRQFSAWGDTFDDHMTKEVFDPFVGFGGIRYDFTLTMRMDGPYFKSFYTVPTGSSASAASVSAWFGGPTGTAADGLPSWSGSYWQYVLASGTASISAIAENLGPAEWNPVVRVTGPIKSGFNIWYQGVDIDGTGLGVVFNYYGADLASGSALCFDTQKLGVKVNGSSSNTWSLFASSSGLPMGYFPALQPGANTLIMFGIAGVSTAASLWDFTNNGAERFRYY
jgi:hypothetical protein